MVSGTMRFTFIQWEFSKRGSIALKGFLAGKTGGVRNQRQRTALPVLDTEVRNAISTAIEKIQACPAPFVDNRTAQAWKDAATYCNNDLVNALTKALTALSVEK